MRIDDALTDPRTLEDSIAAEFIRTSKRALIIAPLIRDGRLVASFYVHQAEPRHWRDDEVTLVQEVAERTWTAVQRARAETALRESEARFRQFAEHSADVLWILNADTMQMEYVSPAYERVWGRSPSALRDRSQWIDSIHPEDRERAFQATEAVLRGRDRHQGVPHRTAGRQHALYPCHRVSHLRRAQTGAAGCRHCQGRDAA